MSDTKYNGWTNYETWVVKLWADNEQATYYEWREWAKNYLNQDEGTLDAWDTPKARAARWLAEALEAEMEENLPELEGVFADLFRSAVGEINWREIAESVVEEVCEEEE